MELELLEQIADDRRDFAFALTIYQGDVVHLKATLLWQLNDGLIEIWKENSEQLVSLSELKAAFANPSLFLSAQEMAQWTITLTDEGQKAAFG